MRLEIEQWALKLQINQSINRLINQSINQSITGFSLFCSGLTECMWPTIKSNTVLTIYSSTECIISACVQSLTGMHGTRQKINTKKNRTETQRALYAWLTIDVVLGCKHASLLRTVYTDEKLPNNDWSLLSTAWIVHRLASAFLIALIAWKYVETDLNIVLDWNSRSAWATVQSDNRVGFVCHIEWSVTAASVVWMNSLLDRGARVLSVESSSYHV